jgi:hypothetical protein
MTEQRSFDRMVHARVAETQEDEAAARAALLAGGASAGGAPQLPASDVAVQRATGRGWEAWLDLLDEDGAAAEEHAAIARRLGEQHGVDAWWAQTITVGYERALGRRSVGERPDGFQVGASKTLAVPSEAAFDALLDPALRARWLPDGELRQRSATRPRSARFDWGEGGSRVSAWISAKGDDRSIVTLTHERLTDAEEADRMKRFWRERLTALKAVLEG